MSHSLSDLLCEILKCLVCLQILEQILGVLFRIAKEHKLDHQHRYVSPYPSLLPSPSKKERRFGLQVAVTQCI